MKKIRFAPSSLLILLVLAAFACKKLPEPAFSYEPAENPEAGEVITFVNETPEASSYIWDFGDGTNATDASPGHTFESAGNYTIKLSATNEDGEASHSESVTINEATVLGFLVADASGKFLLKMQKYWCTTTSPTGRP
ncbi:MAG: PKD domain-containing protein [Bacteroidales bacterium]